MVHQSRHLASATQADRKEGTLRRQLARLDRFQPNRVQGRHMFLKSLVCRAASEDRLQSSSERKRTSQMCVEVHAGLYSSLPPCCKLLSSRRPATIARPPSSDFSPNISSCRTNCMPSWSQSRLSELRLACETTSHRSSSPRP
eukprot:11116818-Alexandrium_andersonii.AAC.1